MFKLIFAGTIEETKQVKDVKADGLMVIARSSDDKVWTRNLELRPKEKFDVSFDADAEELTIKVKMKKGEYISIFNGQGEREVVTL